jgi:parvulin-like peptidyl-prolyl isomerase
MGWIVDGRGLPELDSALAKLEDNKVSEVIETKLGFHLLTILEHQAKGQKTYAEVSDRVRQMMINEKLPPYLGELERNYQVNWKVIKAREEKAPKQPEK